MTSGANRRKAAKKKKKETKPASPTNSQPGNDDPDPKLSPDEKESDSGEVSSPTATSTTIDTNTVEESQQPHKEENQIGETPKEEEQVKVESSTFVSIEQDPIAHEKQEEDIGQSNNDGFKVPRDLSDEQVATKDRMTEGESETILIESGSGSDTDSQRGEEHISKLDESTKVEETAATPTPVQVVPNSEPVQVIQSSEVYDEVEQEFCPPEEVSQVAEETQAKKVESLIETGLPSTDSNGKVLLPLNDLVVGKSIGIEQFRESGDQPASVLVDSVKEPHNNSGNSCLTDTDIESIGVEQKDDEVEKSRKLDQAVASFAAVQIVPNVEMQVGSASEAYDQVEQAVFLSEEASQFMEETAAEKVEKLNEIGYPSIDTKDEILPPSNNRGVETSDEIKQSKESQAPESLHNQIQQREANPPKVRPTSWKNCCGLFDVLMGSNRLS